MNKLVCQNCGSEISNEFGVTLTYCTNCGASIQNLQAEKTADLNDVPTFFSPKLSNHNSQARSKRTVIFLVCLGFAAIFLSALILAYSQTCKISWLSPFKAFVPCPSTNTDLFAGNTDLFSGAALPEAVNQLKKEIGGGQVKALSIHIRPEMLYLCAQDPNNPGRVNAYEYRAGNVKIPRQCQVGIAESPLSETLFELDEINFAEMAVITQNALKQTRLDGSKVSQILIKRGWGKINTGTFSGDIRWEIHLQRGGETAIVRTNAAGQITDTDMSQTKQAAEANFYEGKGLPEAVAEIKKRLGENPKVLSLSVFKNRIHFTAFDPEDPRGVIDYIYQGGGTKVWTRNSAESQKSTHNVLRAEKLTLQDFLFDLDEVNFALISDLTRQTLSRLKITDGQVDSMTIKKVIPYNIRNGTVKDIKQTWYISAKSGRYQSGSVTYDFLGKEIDVRAVK